MVTEKILRKFEIRFSEEIRFFWEKKTLAKYIGAEIYKSDKEALTKSLTKPLVNFLEGEGKRIRPLFFFLVLEVFEKNPYKYINLGLVIELLHNATLIIDDIEDNSELRRGRPTTHRAYGLDVALNAGVALHFLPLYIIDREKNLDEKQKLLLWNIYREEISRVYFGQATDISWHKYGPQGVTVQKYLEMCRLKTGALMRMSVRMACVVAHKDKKVEKALSRFSEKMGIVFQIRDDLLDLEGDTKTFGKAYGNDITEGKISLPVVFSLHELEKPEKNKLISILSKHTKNKKEINKALVLIKKTKALERSRIEAGKLIDEAWKELKKIKLPSQELKKIEIFTMGFIQRNK